MNLVSTSNLLTSVRVAAAWAMMGELLANSKPLSEPTCAHITGLFIAEGMTVDEFNLTVDRTLKTAKFMPSPAEFLSTWRSIHRSTQVYEVAQSEKDREAEINRRCAAKLLEAGANRDTWNGPVDQDFLTRLAATFTDPRVGDMMGSLTGRPMTIKALESATDPAQSKEAQ